MLLLIATMILKKTVLLLKLAGTILGLRLTGVTSKLLRVQLRCELNLRYPAISGLPFCANNPLAGLTRQSQYQYRQPACRMRDVEEGVYIERKSKHKGAMLKSQCHDDVVFDSQCFAAPLMGMRHDRSTLL